jgi:uncharacterized membrane protein YvbJ
MSLIRCPDCEKDVSSRTEKCPNCGCPISKTPLQETSTQETVTIELTSKEIKKQTIYAVLLMMAGLFIAIFGAFISGGVTLLGAVVASIAVIWLVVLKFKTWWHHE